MPIQAERKRGARVMGPSIKRQASDRVLRSSALRASDVILVSYPDPTIVRRRDVVERARIVTYAWVRRF